MNNPAIDAILQDKGKTYELFKDHHIKTSEVRDERQLKDTLSGWRKDMVVLKNMNSSHSDDVYIGTPDDLLKGAYKLPSSCSGIC